MLSGRSCVAVNGRGFALVLFAIWLAACQKGTVTDATLQLPEQGASVSVRRVGAHPFLAEYDRFIVVRSAGKADLVVPMAEDPGGLVRINVYRPSADILLLVDRSGFYKVDLANFTAGTMERIASPSGSTFMGAFDQENRKWQFIGVEKRKELSVENKSAG